MKRSVLTIKEYDYTSKEEFEKDIEVMKKKGYTLIEGGAFNGLTHHEVVGSDTWKYSAYFFKETMC